MDNLNKEEVLAVVKIDDFRDFLEGVTSSSDPCNELINNAVIETLRESHRAYNKEDDSLYFTLENLLNSTVIECTKALQDSL